MPERTNMFINTQAQDLEIAGVYKDLDANLLNLIKTNKIYPPLPSHNVTRQILKLKQANCTLTLFQGFAMIST